MPKINSNGIQMSYTAHGSGEPLVLVMGLGAPGAKWQEHLAVYQKHFRCICIDNRGAGESDKPLLDAYTTEMMAADTLGVMEALGIKSAHVAGISMGGAIAQQMALLQPDAVRSLLLVSTFARAGHYFTRAIEVLRDNIDKMDGNSFSHLLQWMIFAPEYHERHFDDLLRRLAEDATQPGMPAYAFKAQCNACIRHDVHQDLDKIQVPTLVAAGEADLLAPMYATRELYEGIPSAELYLAKGGGHTHHWEQLDAFNEASLSFLLKQRQIT